MKAAGPRPGRRVPDPGPPGASRTDSVQIKCCQCDHHSCVNDPGEKPKT